MKTAFLQRHCFIYCATLLFWALTGCSDSPRRIANEQQHYSSNQQHLFQLIDDYKKSYYDANDANKEKTYRLFQDRMKRFLVDSLGRYIDSMTVTVDTVSEKDWLVTTQFHSRDIELKYGMKFRDSMPPSGDSMYKFMRGFIPGQQVTVGFVHSGGGELNYPDDTSKRTMRIFAYPVPIMSSK